MISGLRPYPVMREAGVPWLGSIPEAWNVVRLKQALREVDQRSSDGSEDLLTVSQYTGVTRRRESVPDGDNMLSRASSLIGYKLVSPGDIVVNIMLAWNGSLGASPVAGITSPAYCVYRTTSGDNPRFLHYLFRTSLYKDLFKMVSTGVVDSRLRLYPDMLLRLQVPFPPVPQQDAIVHYLDFADHQIQRYVKGKRKLIALLNEQKQATTRCAVTRGLDPNVQLKPSGIEWLGDVPEHWHVTRVKNEFKCLNNARVPLSATQRGTMTVRQFEYYGASGAIDKVDSFLFDDDLLLIAEDGANLVLRNLPLAIIARGKFWVNNHAHILKPKRGNLEYLAAVMESISYRPWISGAAQPKLTKDRLLAIKIAIPERAEQDVIVREIGRITGPLERAISRVRREIDLLQELRLTLIAETVTGKFDVRKIAQTVPEESVHDTSECGFADAEDTETIDDGEEENGVAMALT